jgi:phosphatidylglycerophosphate synthase
MGTSLALQQAALLLALHFHRTDRGKPHSLDVVDLLTLSRGAAAALFIGLLSSGVRDRGGPAGWLAWVALLPSVTLTDWIDGPLARRRGPSALGTGLDIECDSWLSLWANCCASAWGGLSPLSITGSVGRYILPVAGRLNGRYCEAVELGKSWWARGTGIVHMTAIVVALAPFAGRFASAVARRAILITTALQLVCLGRVLHQMLKRRPSGEDVEPHGGL